MPTTVKATQIIARNLQAGDLFSFHGPDYWDLFQHIASLGERAYIRTDTPAESADANRRVYKLDIITE